MMIPFRPESQMIAFLTLSPARAPPRQSHCLTLRLFWISLVSAFERYLFSVLEYMLQAVWQYNPAHIQIFELMPLTSPVYLSPNALKSLPSIFGPSIKSDLLAKGSPEGERHFSQLLDQPYSLAVRIDPTRATDFSHWRDAFIRSLSQRVSRFQKDGSLDEAQVERAFKAMDELRTIFAIGKAPKGRALLVHRRSDGKLDYIYDVCAPV